MSQTLYEKVGNRYKPVYEEAFYSRDSERYPEGFSLVYCKPGCTSFRFKVDPDKAAVKAAFKEMVEDELLEVIKEAFASRPRNQPVTPKQKKAWDEFVKAMGNDLYAIQFDSIQGIAEKIMSFAENKATKTKSDVRVF